MIPSEKPMIVVNLMTRGFELCGHMRTPCFGFPEQSIKVITHVYCSEQQQQQKNTSCVNKELTSIFQVEEFERTRRCSPRTSIGRS